ncbi:MAG: hypothetical protein B7O98_01525 [Zestosphaera tikiterensis]|uniref:Phage shock protein PspC N-terminal domain-containing protein n=1 Tax=Zestosphaera tikiterensis TaxID=1973259 RepID=A0A2R7Y6J1_9CREN|nr:MAG: hypothetical protein B7O98_01525 [Zestosphaera tikiterensis]
MRRLFRSRKERVFCGVCGGLAEYLRVDPVLIRLAVVALFLVNPGAAILLYIAACVLMPEAPEEVKSGEGEVVKEVPSKAREATKIALLSIGIALIVVGALVITSKLKSLIDLLRQLWTYITLPTNIVAGLALLTIGTILIIIAVKESTTNNKQQTENPQNISPTRLATAV